MKLTTKLKEEANRIQDLMNEVSDLIRWEKDELQQAVLEATKNDLKEAYHQLISAFFHCEEFLNKD